MAVSPITRRRLEAQGFHDLGDPTMAQLVPWMRWSPALCAAGMIVGVALRSPWVLWALAATAFAGVLLPNHPFDYIYNFGVRHLTGTGPLPANGPQRRFACGLATIWLTATGAAFALHATVLGLVLGVSIASLATLVSVTHICVPSMIYNAIVGRRAVLAR